MRREHKAAGGTVLLSSHILSEVEALADRVSIIRRGRTVTSGSLAELRRHTRTTVHAVTRAEVASLDGVEDLADLVVERVDGHVDTRFTAGPDQLDAAVGRVHAAGIIGLTVHPPSLDALFLSRYGDDPAAADGAATGRRGPAVPAGEPARGGAGGEGERA